MSDFRPKWLILHDYGGAPKGEAPFNPYNALVHNGKVIYRDPSNPYGVRAPHAYKLNGESVGLSWGGPVGGQPSQEDLALLRSEYEKVKALYPDIGVEGHGEAYARTKGTSQQASRDGRDLIEASWRSSLLGVPGVAPPAQANQASVEPRPVAHRGITQNHPDKVTSLAMNSGSAGVPPTGMAGLSGSVHRTPSPSVAPPPAASPQIAGAFKTPGLGSIASGIGAFAKGLGGGGEGDDTARQLAEMNQNMLSDADRQSQAALDLVRKRDKLRMKPTMGVGAFG